MSTSLTEKEAAEAGRKVQSSWDATDVERALAATHSRLHLRRQRLALGAAALVVGAAAAVLLFLGVGRGPQAEPVHGPPPTAAAGASPQGSPTHFADGSEARVDHGGQLVVRTATETRIETSLVAGAAEFDVAPRPGRRFVVQAGEVTVEVVGTRFRVEREAERVRVSVSRGKVRVTAGSELALLIQGESRWFSRSAAPAPVADAAPERADAAGAHAATSDTSSPRERFVDLARRGDYGEAYRVIAESPHAVGSSAEDLMLAADAARLSNHPGEALKFLRRVTREHPRDSRAALSAFTEGRILLSQLGRPEEAATAFELARRLAPSGALAEPALARQVEALTRAGDLARARVLAAEHRKRFPGAKDVVVPGSP